MRAARRALLFGIWPLALTTLAHAMELTLPCPRPLETVARDLADELRADRDTVAWPVAGAVGDRGSSAVPCATAPGAARPLLARLVRPGRR